MFETPYVVPGRIRSDVPRRLIACRVRVRTQSGDTYSYHALVANTCAAVNDALDYFGQCKVRAAACTRRALTA